MPCEVTTVAQRYWTWAAWQQPRSTSLPCAGGQSEDVPFSYQGMNLSNTEDTAGTIICVYELQALRGRSEETAYYFVLKTADHGSLPANHRQLRR